MGHISGLVATQEFNSPFEYCDVAFTATHKTLRGPYGMIFLRRNLRTILISLFFLDYKEDLNHQIAGVTIIGGSNT